VVSDFPSTFETTRELDGRTVRVVVVDEPGGDAVADELLQWTAEHSLELLVACAEALLEDRNAGWQRFDGDVVDPARFMLDLGVKRIWRGADGSMRWTYDAGRHFWGHDVVVSAGPDRRVVDVGIEG
jgi:hypothetical protein